MAGDERRAGIRERWDAYRAEAVAPRLLIVRQLPHAGAGLAAALLAVNVLLGLMPVLFVVETSVLIGRVPDAVRGGTDSAAWHALVTAFLVASAAFAGQQVLAPLQAALGERVQRRVDGYFTRRLMASSLAAVGIAPLEDQRTLDALREASRRLETSWHTPGHATAGLLALVARYTRLLALAVLVGAVTAPAAGAAILGAALVFRYGQRGGQRKYARVFKEHLPAEREAAYFRDVATGADAAKEIRVFGLAGWLSDRYRSSHLDSLYPMWRARRRIYLKPYFGYTALGLLTAGAVTAWTARGAAAGTFSLTALALALQAAVAALLLGEHYPESDANTQFGMDAVRGLADFESRLAERLPGDVTADATGDARGLPREGVRFRDVSFRYAGGRRPVLDGLDLVLRAGECTAIVGLNGAGKTTLVKLLARMYEPTGGTVLVDGQDVRTFAVDSWRRQIAVIFQDFNRYELSAADNIALGAVERPPDAAAVRSAAQKAGVAGALERLPRGYDTPLSRQYEGGAQLSGGQWQRVAIARALYALDAGARVLVLDEPTAALDVRAEREFFSRFVELTRGVTTLLISHRFSSVRHADRIVVLEDGRVAEDGTHGELLARGGRYAELFRLQAERFAEPERPGAAPAVPAPAEPTEDTP
ncbi:ABC transporter ATP-binding protein [Streptomyces sp. Ru87]|uniref:ABC transporter ATP-binding protein n=1 Tax=Streptomyces sp. Ru87 TaxID=2044307 RepID=UPI000BFA5F5B|nr:ATP-binding cassette domain-containing protein [Streptomyces sp. Ru87]PGH51980.1 multidrug ABC transporter permease [Streptomyces sp. Ru87]